MHITPLKITVVAALAIGLSACAEIPEQEDQSRAPPSQNVIEVLAAREYTGFNQRAPKDLQLTKITQANLFNSKLDTVVCMSATEVRESPAFRNDGSTVYSIGDPYRGDYVMMVRDAAGPNTTADDGWSATLFRRATLGVKIGGAHVPDICPLSE